MTQTIMQSCLRYHAPNIRCTIHNFTRRIQRVGDYQFHQVSTGWVPATFSTHRQTIMLKRAIRSGHTTAVVNRIPPTALPLKDIFPTFSLDFERVLGVGIPIPLTASSEIYFFSVSHCVGVLIISVSDRKRATNAHRTAATARCSAFRVAPDGAWIRPGVSIRIMLGQNRYSIRMLISRESKERTGSLSNRRFSDSM